MSRQPLFYRAVKAPAVLFACSANPGKLREFSNSGYPVQPLPQLSLIRAPEENGRTFEENASLKAVYYSRFTTELVMADDSGLEVNALGGEPGIYSARFAGVGATDQANNELLLQRMSGARLLGKFDRRACFVCVIALARHGEIVRAFRGSVEGEILSRPRGAQGFGYDPLFFYPPLARSFAELQPEEKFLVSHRGEATRLLFEFLLEAK